MEKRYRLYDNLISWSLFLIAALTYFLSMQSSVSWWDCGEFISTTYKLEVPHAPGNPTFQLIGRIFTLFAFGDATKVALMVNAMSALCSAFTILFLFKTITLLAKKIILRNKNDMTSGNMLAIFGAGIIGSLVYTFSDTFWFSAVEGEVYAMSSFFTAVVFWVMLKWEEEADKPYAMRWIILNAFLIGLAIGVHLLNLLTIPALAYIYYYRKFELRSWKGWLMTGIISVALIGIILWIIIPWTVEWAGYFDLFFVNSIGLPFNYGAFIFFILLGGVLLFGIIYSEKRKKVLLNTIILSVTFLLIGYSSFFSIVVRANETLPINMNEPSDPMGMVSYLNRDQYISQPLVYGQYYSTPGLDYENGKQQYYKKAVEDPNTGKKKYEYVASGFKNGTVIYPSEGCTLFPRMWSNEAHHVSEYKAWGGEPQQRKTYQTLDGKRESFHTPTFGQNLKFFFNYHVGHMYLRYFMWNFSGRQNNVEGHGEISNGNWITGFDFIDGPRVGVQSDLPPSLQNDANNRYYLLPLILGLIGIFFALNKNLSVTWIVFLLFFMTGLAIVIYLNQTPLQPRERDYAYAGSFYAFAIWIGFSVLAIYNYLRNKINEKLAATLVTVVLLSAPILMLAQNWDDHDRSDNFGAHDYGINYLNSCPPNAILFTVGDNDTYPLWYAQEVEGIRSDVRVINYGLSAGTWYANMAMHKINDSEKLPFTLSIDDYQKGVNDYIYLYNSSEMTVSLKDGIDFVRDKKNQRTLSDGTRLSWLPTNNFYIPVNKEELLNSGLTSLEELELVEDTITIQIKGRSVLKNGLLFLDILSTNNWKRPICFTSPLTIRELTDLSPYIHLTGFAYQLLPFKAEGYIPGYGGIRIDTAYEFFTNKYMNGAFEKPHVSLDRESYRQTDMTKQHLYRLAQALIAKNDLERAKKVLIKMFECFPNDKITYLPGDQFILAFIEYCFQVKADALALEIAHTYLENAKQEISYFNRQTQSVQQSYKNTISKNVSNLSMLGHLMKDYGHPSFEADIISFLKML
ncbi:MAG: DUF2723 domain-containing protein [Bacteroidales bacterium]|jgi:hypothetical protein|nr:DUF2723 domain-containing protein [Bacteroidales bacterium]